MPKPLSDSGKKNLISENLIELRHRRNLSQRGLAHELPLVGCDMDKNVITRIDCEVLHTAFEGLTKNNHI